MWQPGASLLSEETTAQIMASVRPVLALGSWVAKVEGKPRLVTDAFGEATAETDMLY